MVQYAQMSRGYRVNSMPIISLRNTAPTQVLVPAYADDALQSACRVVLVVVYKG